MTNQPELKACALRIAKAVEKRHGTTVCYDASDIIIEEIEAMSRPSHIIISNMVQVTGYGTGSSGRVQRVIKSVIPEDAVQYVSDDAPPEGFMYATGSELFQVLGKSKEDADSLERGVNAVIRRTDMASVKPSACEIAASIDNTTADEAKEIQRLTRTFAEPVTDDALREAVEYLLNFNGQEHIVNLWDESFTTEGKGKLCNALEILITHALNAEHRGKLLECYGGTEKCGEALAEERYKAYMQGFNDAMKGQSK